MINDYGVAPWHMWGNQLPVTVVATAAPFDLNTSQLVNINYGRPETWSWIFWATIISDTGAGNPGVLQVRFNLTIGVGRTRVQMDNFVTMLFGPPLPTPTQSWTTTTTDPQTRLLSDIPAQDIILNATTIITGGAAPGTSIDLLVGAMFAPKSHVRPEWFEGRFRGGENDGK